MAFATKLLSNALLTQASHEFVGYLSYTEASHWFNIRHLTGISKKLKLEADEERKHFEEILDYLSKRGQEVKIPYLPYASPIWTCEKTVFSHLLDLEKENFNKLNLVFKLAREHSDSDMERFLQKFIQDQIDSVNE